VDTEAICGQRAFSGTSLSEALRVVATHRGVAMAPMGQVLAAMSSVAQPRWSAWRRKQRLEDSTPEQFSVLLARCAEFADPVIEGTARERCWSPGARRWQQQTPHDGPLES
jgi:hypothetical protein